MEAQRVAVIAGGRTPFIKAGNAFKDLGPLAMGVHAVKGLLDRHQVDTNMIESLAFGTMVPDPGKPNLARELVFETGLPAHIEAQTVASYCITGLRTITLIADAIASGRIDTGLAGGVDSLSHSSPDLFREPSTGLSMGEHMERTAKAWQIPRRRQDELALSSHQNAVAARERLTPEIFPLLGEPNDSGPRSDTSLEALTGLRGAFDPNHGTLTAGNSSPVTDGAAAVLLMSEEKARAENRQPLVFIRGMQYSAHDPADGLLMAPAIAVPRLLTRAGLKMPDMDLIEIHEAFAAQALANVEAWEQGWKGEPTGPVDWSRVNVNGSSIAIGHPWSATGARIITTLAYEMQRRNARYGLVSICAAGAMAGAFLLERESQKRSAS
jgi:acetyl-CoA acyltransferase